MPRLDQAFVEASRDHLVGEYIPKIRACLDSLSPGDEWWRPNSESNAVGNLVLHLSGNARQWLLHGVLGRDDDRTRDAEFAADASERVDLSERLVHLTTDMNEAFDAIASMCADDPAYLDGLRTIQGLEVSVLRAIYHVVEHFAQHTGQIIYITKLRNASDLGFWDVRDGVARPTW